MTVASYFLNGLAAVFDKILLGKRLPDPLVFAFFTGITSLGVLILAPFGFAFIYGQAMAAAFISGAASLASIYFFYEALRLSDTTRVVPLVGLSSPLFILGLNYVAGREYLQGLEFSALFFFIAAGVFLSIEWHTDGLGSNFHILAFLLSLASAFFLALTLFYAKIVFEESPFIAGFIWIRLWAATAAASLLILAGLRRRIFTGSLKTTSESYGFFLTNKVIGAAGFILLSYSIKLGPASVINAMRGLENLFVFLLALFFTIFFPRVLKESFSWRSLLFKTMGILLAGIGFIYLTA